jgi:predicted HAD superfamily Cof-like phosphohydrolase
MADIADFHHKFEISYHGRPRALPPELGFFRTKFMQEELDEYKTHRDELLDIFGNERATSKIDEERITKLLEEQLDAIVDLVYVALGTAYLHGFEYNRFYEAWRRVHKKNMEKIRVASAEESKRGSAFDVVKPAGWTPPRHTDLVEDHVHRAL